MLLWNSLNCDLIRQLTALQPIWLTIFFKGVAYEWTQMW